MCSKTEIPIQLLEQAQGVPAGKAPITISSGLHVKQTLVCSLPMCSFSWLTNKAKTSDCQHLKPFKITPDFLY